MANSRRHFLRTVVGAASALTINNASAAMHEMRDVPWLAEVQQPPTTGEKNRALPSLLFGNDRNPITTSKSWADRRKSIEQWWREFLQPLAMPTQPPKLTVVHEDRPKGVIRQLVRYQSEPGITVEGYLLKPEHAKRDGSHPGVVVLHSTVNHTIRQSAGVEGKPEKAFGLSLAQAGMVTFSPKCFLWVGEGNYNQRVDAFTKRHPKSKGMAKMLYDAQLAVSILDAQPEVDRKRIGSVGHSLGAKEVLYLAAFDSRVKATVSSEGGISVRFSNWNAPWYLGKSIDDSKFKRDHHELLALIAPRPFLLVGGDSADGDRSWPFVEAALPVYRLLEPNHPPRLGLLNHKKGHAVPPIAERRIAQWLKTYLA